LGNKFRFDIEFLISSLGGIPLGIKNRIDVEFIPGNSLVTRGN
jgi:hypothetical protein